MSHVLTCRPFEHQGRRFRTLQIQGKPWFVAADVCRWLEIKDTSDTVARIHPSQKGTALIGTLGGPQQMLVVSEGGLYSLVGRSHQAATPGTPQAEWWLWVTEVVLPQIRETGSYGPNAFPNLADPRQQHRFILDFAEAVQKRIEAEARAQVEQGLRQVAEATLGRAQPKLDLFHQLIDSDGMILLSLIGKPFQHGPRKLLARLETLGYLYRRQKRLVPRQDLIDRGYFVMKLRTVDGKLRQQAYLTPKGIPWISDRLGLVAHSPAPTPSAPSPQKPNSGADIQQTLPGLPKGPRPR